MAPLTHPQRRAYHAKRRRLQKARERLQHEHARAQRHLQALQHALGDLDLPEIRAEEVQWRLNALTTLLDTIFGLMFPPLFGCRSDHELCRVRGWDKNLPGRLLGALPTRPWVKPLPRRGQALLAHRWQHLEDNSPALRSRWPWTWVGDDSLVNKVWPAPGAGGHLVERPGTSRPARDGWVAVDRGDR